jgi:hypothetical protein
MTYCEFRSPLDATRHPAWTKISAVRLALTFSDWAMLVDADALFVNFDFDARELIAKHGKARDLIFSTDYDNGPSQADEDAAYHAGSVSVNTGVFLARSSLWTETFLDRVYVDFPELIQDATWEQSAVRAFRAAHSEEWTEHATVVPFRRMNSWWRKFTPGDFILHHGDGEVSDKYAHLWEMYEEARRGGAGWPGNTVRPGR